MLLPAALGLIAGVAGGLAGYSYYLGGLVVDTNGTTAPGRPVFSVTSPLPETELAARLATLDVAIYAKKNLPSGELADRLLAPDKATARAAVITSDGWLLTHASALRNGPIVVLVNGKLVDPKASVTDPATGALFLKVDGGPFQVSGLEETDKLRPGSALYALDAAGGFTKAIFSGTTLTTRPNRPMALRSSETFARSWNLGHGYSPAAAGGAVMTVGGNLAGILVASSDVNASTFVPMHLLRAVMPDIFKGAPIKRPILGVNYLDLKMNFAGSAPEGTGLVLASSKRDGIPAVLSNSPAASVGLQEGDILLRLGDADLFGGRDLAEILADYRPGAGVRLELMHKGIRQTADVVLK